MFTKFREFLSLDQTTTTTTTVRTKYLDSITSMINAIYFVIPWKFAPNAKYRKLIDRENSDLTSSRNLFLLNAYIDLDLDSD